MSMKEENKISKVISENIVALYRNSFVRIAEENPLKILESDEILRQTGKSKRSYELASKLNTVVAVKTNNQAKTLNHMYDTNIFISVAKLISNIGSQDSKKIFIDDLQIQDTKNLKDAGYILLGGTVYNGKALVVREI